MPKTKQPLQCPLGKKPYWSKQAAQDAHPGQPVERCAQCRYYHPTKKKGKGR